MGCQALSERASVPSDIRERSSELVARVERACLAHQARCPPQELGASVCVIDRVCVRASRIPTPQRLVLALVRSYIEDSSRLSSRVFDLLSFSRNPRKSV